MKNSVIILAGKHHLRQTAALLPDVISENLNYSKRKGDFGMENLTKERILNVCYIFGLNTVWSTDCSHYCIVSEKEMKTDIKNNRPNSSKV